MFYLLETNTKEERECVKFSHWGSERKRMCNYCNLETVWSNDENFEKWKALHSCLTLAIGWIDVNNEGLR